MIENNSDTHPNESAQEFHLDAPVKQDNHPVGLNKDAIDAVNNFSRAKPEKSMVSLESKRRYFFVNV
jgi:hypothetical protein